MSNLRPILGASDVQAHEGKNIGLGNTGSNFEDNVYIRVNSRTLSTTDRAGADILIVNQMSYINKSKIERQKSQYGSTQNDFGAGTAPGNGLESNAVGGGVADDFQITSPLMKYVSEATHHSVHQLPNIFSSKEHADLSGSVYPINTNFVHLNRFDILTTPSVIEGKVSQAQMNGGHGFPEISYRAGVTFTELSSNFYVGNETESPGAIVPTAHTTKLDNIGYKVPKHHFMTSSTGYKWDAALVDGPLKISHALNYDLSKGLDYYYHFERTNDQRYKSVTVVDSRMRDTMPCWHNLIGEGNDNTFNKFVRIASYGEPGGVYQDFPSHSFDRTEVAFRTPQATIFVSDPGDEGNTPFVQFIDRNLQRGSVEQGGIIPQDDGTAY